MKFHHLEYDVQADEKFEKNKKEPFSSIIVMNLPNRFEDFVVKEVMLIHMFLSLSSFVIIQLC